MNNTKSEGVTARLKEIEPCINLEGQLCGICDGTYFHQHSNSECCLCGQSGLTENMINHRCISRSHSATPWSVGSVPHHDGRPYGMVTCVYSSEQIRICTIEDWAGDAAKESDANAQFIVHAVNCHDALLEACKVALEGVTCHCYNGGEGNPEPKTNCDCWGCNTARQLNAAITRATTEKEGAK